MYKHISSYKSHKMSVKCVAISLNLLAQLLRRPPTKFTRHTDPVVCEFVCYLNIKYVYAFAYRNLSKVLTPPPPFTNDVTLKFFILFMCTRVH